MHLHERRKGRIPESDAPMADCMRQAHLAAARGGSWGMVAVADAISPMAQGEWLDAAKVLAAHPRASADDFFRALAKVDAETLARGVAPDRKAHGFSVPGSLLAHAAAGGSAEKVRAVAEAVAKLTQPAPSHRQGPTMRH